MVGLGEGVNTGEPVNVDRDTLVEFRCKRGGRETKEQCRVLGTFFKYYNTCFFSLKEIIGWGNNKPAK